MVYRIFAKFRWMIALPLICVADLSVADEEPLKRARYLSSYCDRSYIGESEYAKCDEAIAMTRRVLEGDPENVKALGLLASLLNRRFDERAVPIIRKILDLDSDNADALRLIMRWLPTWQEKLPYMRKLAEVAPDDYYIHGDLARAELATGGDEALVLAAIKRQIELNPEDESIWRLFGELKERGNIDALVQILESYVKSKGIQESKCNEFFGAYWANLDQDKIRGDAYRLNVLYFEQCGGYAYYEFAMIEADPTRRLQLLQKAIQHLPNHDEARGELAVALYSTAGDLSGAMVAIRSQYNRSWGHGDKFVVRLAKLLREKGGKDDYVSFLSDYLEHARKSKRKGVPKCDMLKTLGVKGYLDVPEIAEAVGAECADLLDD